ncbi:hypothetical protein ACS0TY_015148 [Phlomoides rotata]
MESGGSSSLGLKKTGRKNDRNRRSWTPVEENVLVELMKGLVAKGWKTENGFKPGYLLKLEVEMMNKLPGTDIRANPHITSLITIWKKNSWFFADDVERQLWNRVQPNYGYPRQPRRLLGANCQDDYFTSRVSNRVDLGILAKINVELGKENKRRLRESYFGQFIGLDDVQFQGQLYLHLLFKQSKDKFTDKIVFHINNTTAELGPTEFP